MVTRDKHEHFSPVTIALHWLLAVAIIGMIPFGFSLEDLPDGEAKTARVALHISIGLLVLLFGSARLAWRLANGLPRPAGDHARWERTLARVVHVVLLVAPIYMPLAGLLFAFGKGYAVGFFGLTLIPASAAAPEVLGEIGHVLHGLGGVLLSVAILLHVGGTLKGDVLNLVIAGLYNDSKFVLPHRSDDRSRATATVCSFLLPTKLHISSTSASSTF